MVSSGQLRGQNLIGALSCTVRVRRPTKLVTDCTRSQAVSHLYDFDVGCKCQHKVHIPPQIERSEAPAR